MESPDIWAFVMFSIEKMRRFSSWNAPLLYKAAFIALTTEEMFLSLVPW